MIGRLFLALLLRSHRCRGRADACWSSRPPIARSPIATRRRSSGWRRSSATDAKFVLVYPVPTDSPAMIRAHTQEVRVCASRRSRDADQKLVKQTGVTVTPEVAVMSGSTHRVSRPDRRSLHRAWQGASAADDSAIWKHALDAVDRRQAQSRSAKPARSDAFSRTGEMNARRSCARLRTAHAVHLVHAVHLDRRAQRADERSLATSRRSCSTPACPVIAPAVPVLSAHHLRRSAPPRHADRAGHAQPFHAAVEG